jgi:DNA polymerase-1
MAYLSQDKRMLEVYANDEDLHEDMAKFAGVERDFAKTLNFGMAYGLVEKTFAANTGLPLKKVQEMYAKHEERFPGLYKMFANIRQFTRETGYTITMSGRRRRIPEIYSDNFVEKAHAQRQAVNTTIQGSAGDLIKLAMINLYENTDHKEVQMAAQIHDELLLYIPDVGKDEEYLEKIQHLFETAMVVKSIRFKAEGKICATWADKNLKAPKVEV